MATAEPAVVRPPDATAFLDLAGPLLAHDEARHNLIYGIATTLHGHPDRYAEKRFWVVTRDGLAVAAALRTPPHNLVLAQPTDDAALVALARAIAEELPGVTGALPEAEAFAAAWCSRRGTTPNAARAQRAHAATAIEHPAGVPGRARPPRPDERRLVFDWYRAFVLEAVDDDLDDEDDERLRRSVEHNLTAPEAGFLLWDDGGPVSFAGWGGPTPNGIRIGPVYTPPALRGRGYAGALVARLSQDLLDEGRRFCFLFTDLANPTANRLYAHLGYEPVCDAAEISFERQP
jgi:predicted GNAT family acetyltransferase